MCQPGQAWPGLVKPGQAQLGLAKPHQAKFGQAWPGCTWADLDWPSVVQTQYSQRFCYIAEKMDLDKGFRMHRSKTSGRLSLSIVRGFCQIVPQWWGWDKGTKSKLPCVHDMYVCFTTNVAFF